MPGREEFQGVNAGYLAELYERYERDPNTVDPESRALFDQWREAGTPPEAPVAPPPAAAAQFEPGFAEKIVGAVNLAQSIRRYGHLAAQLDPLGTPPGGDPSLDPATHNLTNADLQQLPASVVKGACATGCRSASTMVATNRPAPSSAKAAPGIAGSGLGDAW